MIDNQLFILKHTENMLSYVNHVILLYKQTYEALKTHKSVL